MIGFSGSFNSQISRTIIFWKRIHSKTKFLNEKNVIRDMLYTVCSFIDIFNNVKSHKIRINRIGTNPLEHSFGMVRMRSKDHHNAQRFIKEVNNINSLRNI